MPEFFEKSPLSEAGKYCNFQVTFCHHFVTTNVKFDELGEHQTSKVRDKLQRESSRFISVFWTPACAGVTVWLFHYLIKHQ